MVWNWQSCEWPGFRFESGLLDEFEAEFTLGSGVWLGTHRHMRDEDKNSFFVDALSDEAVKTSEIEGEILNRESVKSSLRRCFGLATEGRRGPPAERGIAEMMADLHKNFSAPLTHETLFRWHRLLLMGRRDVDDVGCYRTHQDPMQIVSGILSKPTVHFEAPPSRRVTKEMNYFLKWFNRTAPGVKGRLPVLTRAAIAHLYFVSIHPFEDGNGRIGRAIVEKVLSQNLGQPALIALSQTIELNRKAYYSALESNNKDIEISPWLVYFARTILAAQRRSQAMLDFLIEKTKFYDKFRERFNVRQEKVIARMLREGPIGFEGGMSAEKYIVITKTSRATATRDLQELVKMGALVQIGVLKSTRYHLQASNMAALLAPAEADVKTGKTRSDLLP